MRRLAVGIFLTCTLCACARDRGASSSPDSGSHKKSPVATKETEAAPRGVSPLAVDEVAKRIVCGAGRLDLTAHEFRLAAVLVKHPERVFSRDQLLDHAWDDPGAVTDRTVDAHVKSLRAKLRSAAPGSEEMIQTRRGMGYSYSPAGI